MTLVAGLDLSLTSTGIALVEVGEGLRSTKAIKSKKDGDTLADWCARIDALGMAIYDEVFIHRPDLIVIESPSFGSKFGNAHERGGLWWELVLQAWREGFEIATVTPAQRAKYGTGNGRADKKDVHAAVKVRYGTPELRIQTDDEGDAVLLAAMGARFLGGPIDDDPLPASHLDAMEKVKWPQVTPT